MTAARPTLLVFTLGAASESARRSLLPEPLKGMEIGLRQTCLEAALDAGAACGCSLEVCSPAPPALPLGVRHVPQQEGGFGARLERSIADAFARTAGAPLMVVGTDVPGLGALHLEQALARLAEDAGRVVLGPSPDGGIYLLAAARPLPPLAGVRWCRRETLADLRRALAAAGREVVLLEPLADLDRPADLERWLAAPAAASERWHMISGLLRRALAERRRLVPPRREKTPRRVYTSVFTGRAPPSSLFH